MALHFFKLDVQSRELRILTLSVVPTVVLLNYLMFGNRYVSEWGLFFITTACLLFVCSLVHKSYSQLIKIFRQRFPHQSQTGFRIGITILTFVISSGLALALLFKIYTVTGFMGFRPNDAVFAQSFAVVIVINAFMMFVYETMANFDNYMANVKATDALRKEYLESQLIGLKSQMNPHFLFNSLNTLSSLLQDDNNDAEVFLDHMSKVFRYLLRTHEEKQVLLKNELQFLQSYLHLLKARYKEALEVQIDVAPEELDACMPPLTLQMVIENIIAANVVSRNEPLLITVQTGNGQLQIANNRQPKQTGDGADSRSLNNIINKFRLLWSAEVVIKECSGRRLVCIPLITQNVPCHDA